MDTVSEATPTKREQARETERERERERKRKRQRKRGKACDYLHPKEAIFFG